MRHLPGGEDRLISLDSFSYSELLVRRDYTLTGQRTRASESCLGLSGRISPEW